MKLASSTDFAFRLLIHVSLQDGKLVTIQEVADAFSLSYHHLTKISQLLIQNGVLEAQRGRGGGIRLAKPADEIHLDEIVLLSEPDPELVNCDGGLAGPCKIVPVCRLRGIFTEARSAFLEVLKRYSLADVIGAPSLQKKLRQLLDQ